MRTNVLRKLDWALRPRDNPRGRRTATLRIVDRVDPREVFIAQVRALQSIYPAAHAALKNWGSWSRELHGVFPSVAHPGWTEFYVAPQEWGEEPLALAPLPVPQQHVRPEREKEARADEKAGMELDARIHDDDFPVVWRNVLAAAYVTVEVPEDQFPALAGRKGPPMSHEDFLRFLEGAMEFLE